MIVLTRYLPRSTGACAKTPPVVASNATAISIPRVILFSLPKRLLDGDARLARTTAVYIRIIPARECRSTQSLESRVDPPRRVVEEVAEAVLVLAGRPLARGAAGEAVIGALDIDQLLVGAFRLV